MPRKSEELRIENRENACNWRKTTGIQIVAKQPLMRDEMIAR